MKTLTSYATLAWEIYERINPWMEGYQAAAWVWQHLQQLLF